MRTLLRCSWRRWVFRFRAAGAHGGGESSNVHSLVVALTYQNSHFLSSNPQGCLLCTRWLLLCFEAALSSCGHKQSGCDDGMHSFWFGQQKRSCTCRWVWEEYKREDASYVRRTLPHSTEVLHIAQIARVVVVVVVVVVVGNDATAFSIMLLKSAVCEFILGRSHAYYIVLKRSNCERQGRDSWLWVVLGEKRVLFKGFLHTWIGSNMSTCRALSWNVTRVWT